jgi:hypothetical protein
MQAWARSTMDTSMTYFAWWNTDKTRKKETDKTENRACGNG